MRRIGAEASHLNMGLPGRSLALSALGRCGLYRPEPLCLCWHPGPGPRCEPSCAGSIPIAQCHRWRHSRSLVDSGTAGYMYDPHVWRHTPTTSADNRIAVVLVG